jgi:integrase
LREADPPLRWHDLRHTFASHAARAMRSLSDVQALCGHADLQTTMRYVHYRPGADEAQRLAAAFAEPDPLEQAVARPARGAHRVPPARAEAA